MPITLSDVVVTPGFGQAFLQWTVNGDVAGGLPFNKLDRVEVFAATTNSRDAATKVAEGVGAAVHYFSDGAARYYWLRPRKQQVGTRADGLRFYDDWYPESPSGGLSAAATADTDATGFVKLPGGLVAEWGSTLTNIIGEVEPPLQRITLPFFYGGFAKPFASDASYSVHNAGLIGSNPVQLWMRVMVAEDGGGVAHAVGGIDVNWFAVGR